MSTKDARDIIERALERFDLSHTLRKKIAAAILDEFQVQSGATADGKQRFLALVRVEEP